MNQEVQSRPGTTENTNYLRDHLTFCMQGNYIRSCCLLIFQISFLLILIFFRGNNQIVGPDLGPDKTLKVFTYPVIIVCPEKVICCIYSSALVAIFFQEANNKNPDDHETASYCNSVI